jgi:predicted transcriptional regulator
MTTPWNFQPAAIAQRLQKLCRAGKIGPHDVVVGLALLWSCRAPGSDKAMVSFDRLASLAGVGRTTAVKAVAKLRALGVLAREKTRLRVVWGLGTASRQGRNIYTWHAAPGTEFAGRPTIQVQVSKQEAHEQERRPILPGLSGALAALAERIGAANRGAPI